MTDFGLAKATDQQNLTHTGDVVGTLRYMAPEQFDGAADERSDTYSLGLTLYELLALRPGFNQTDRQQLLKAVTSQMPPPLQSLDSHIPRDLATVVHRAIERDPSHRYATAGELRDDLRRFLKDEPIRARRPSPLARCQRWCRKNPVIAALSLCLMSAVLFLAIAQTNVSRERNRFREALFTSLVSQSKFHRLSGESGQRWESLQAIAEAAGLEPAPELRDQAVRCMTLHDLEPTSRWPVTFPSYAIDSVDVSDDLQLYVTYSDRGVEVCRRSSVPAGGDDQLQCAFATAEWSSGESFPRAAAFSSCSRYLMVSFFVENSGILYVWDLTTQQRVLRIEGVAEKAFGIHSPTARLACGRNDESGHMLQLWDLSTASLLREARLPSAPFECHFDPGGRQLAVTLPASECVQIRDVDHLEVIFEHDYGEDIYAIGWHPSGQQLCVGKGFDVDYSRIEMLDAPLRVFSDHRWMVHQVQVHPSGNYLASHSLREGRTKLWDLRQRELLLTVTGHLVKFSRDGNSLVTCHMDELCEWDFLQEQEYEHLATPDHHFRSQLVGTLSSGKLVVEGGDDGLRIWSHAPPRLVYEDRSGSVQALAASELHQTLVVARQGTLTSSKVAFRSDGHADLTEKTVLPVDFSGLPAEERVVLDLCVSRDGTLLAIVLKDHPRFYLYDIPARTTRSILCDRRTGFCAISPDNRWIALSNSEYPGFYLHKLSDQSPPKLLATEGSGGQIVFSPDSSRLVLCANDRYVLFDVLTQKRLQEIRTPSVVEGCAAFDSTGKWLAISMLSREVHLLDSATLTKLVTLATEQQRINTLRIAFPPQDAGPLVVACGDGGTYLWNLGQLRETLSQHGLDWE